MTTIKTNLDDVIKQLREFIDRRENELKQVAKLTPRQVGKVIKDEIIAEIREQGLIASGQLVRSVSVTGVRSSNLLSEAFVGSSSPYAKFVEEGVKSGGKMPPTQAIYRWMIHKGMEASESGAYLIARKIARDGIDPKRPFEKGVERGRAKIDHEMEILLNKTLKKD